MHSSGIWSTRRPQHARPSPSERRPPLAPLISAWRRPHIQQAAAPAEAAMGPWRCMHERRWGTPLACTQHHAAPSPLAHHHCAVQLKDSGDGGARLGLSAAAASFPGASDAPEGQCTVLAVATPHAVPRRTSGAERPRVVRGRAPAAIRRSCRGLWRAWGHGIGGI